MKAKAASTLADAIDLAGRGRWSGAANRTYYALYQALVGELEAKGHRPEHFERGDPGRPGWRHFALLSNARLAALSRAEVDVARDAWQLRVQADYRPEPVRAEELRPILAGARVILAGLGVPP